MGEGISYALGGGKTCHYIILYSKYLVIIYNSQCLTMILNIISLLSKNIKILNNPQFHGRIKQVF